MPPLLGHFLLVLFSLALILLAAELFTNAIEWLGAKLNLAEGAVGSVLAAVGTALPETIIPVVAIASDALNGRLGTPQSAAESVGLGAIVGAPFMLGTLAFFIVGFTYLVARARGRRHDMFNVDGSVIRHDVEFFLIAFSLGCGAGLLRHYWPAMPHWLDWTLAATLVMVYIIYFKRVTVAGEKSDTNELSPLHFAKYLMRLLNRLIDLAEDGLPRNAQLRWLHSQMHAPQKRSIALQIAVALAAMLYGAHLFVGHLSPLALAIGVHPLILALLIVPVATELPEKFNSVLWVVRGKDTLAMGNISGAMVFQSTFPISLGLIFLNWSFSPLNPAFISACFGLLGALAVYVNLRRTNEINPWYLLLGGALYLGFVLLVVLHLSGVIHLAVDPAALAAH